MPRNEYDYDTYERAISNGCTPKLADMLASRQPPGAKSDTQTFTRDFIHGTWKHIPEVYREEAMRKMRAAGVNPDSQAYISQLADHPMDPNACVSNMGEYRRKCEERGFGLEGMGTKIHARNDKPPTPDVDICPKIVEREFQEAIADNPDLAPTPREKADLREKIKNDLKVG